LPQNQSGIVTDLSFQPTANVLPSQAIVVISATSQAVQIKPDILSPLATAINPQYNQMASDDANYPWSNHYWPRQDQPSHELCHDGEDRQHLERSQRWQHQDIQRELKNISHFSFLSG